MVMGTWVLPRVLGAALARYLVAVLVLGLTIACGDDSQPSTLRSGGGQVRGMVASAKTGEGVPNLVVVLLRDGQIVRAVPTNATGDFDIGDVEAGEYVVRLVGFELAGLSLINTAFTPMERAIVVAGEVLDLTFAAVGIIPAKIVGEVRCGGMPVSGARIRVVGGQTDKVVETNVVGRYGANDLAAGSYTVMLIDAPCAITSEYDVLFVNSGQSVTADFAGRSVTADFEGEKPPGEPW